MAGDILGANWALVVDLISSYQKLVLALIGLGVAVFVVSRVLNVRRTGEPA